MELKGMGSNIIFEFADSTGTGEFRQVASIDLSSPQQSAAIDSRQQMISERVADLKIKDAQLANRQK